MSPITRGVLVSANRGKEVVQFGMNIDSRMQIVLLKLRCADGITRRVILPSLVARNLGQDLARPASKWNVEGEVVDLLTFDASDLDAVGVPVVKSSEVHADLKGAYFAGEVDKPKRIYFSARFNPAQALALSKLIEAAIERRELWFMDETTGTRLS